jgi:hypothetical protein
MSTQMYVNMNYSIENAFFPLTIPRDIINRYKCHSKIDKKKVFNDRINTLLNLLLLADTKWID